MVGGGEGGLDDEAAAVEVDEEGEFLASVGVFRQEEAGGEIDGRCDFDVFGVDCGEWVQRRGDEAFAHESLDSATFVDSEKREKVIEYFVGHG